MKSHEKRRKKKSRRRKRLEEVSWRYLGGYRCRSASHYRVGAHYLK